MSCSSIFRSRCLLSEPCSISYREGSAIRNLLAPHTGGLSASAYRGLSTKSFIGANRIGPLPEPEPTAYTLVSTFPAYGGLRFLPNAGSISARPASVKRGRGARWLLANPDAKQ